MAAPVIDIRVLGDKELSAALAELEPRIQRKVVRQSLRKSCKRLKAEVVANLSGRVVQIETGRYVRAMSAEKIHALPRSRSKIGQAFNMPTRASLGIEPGDKGYYPFAIEYGTEKDRKGRGPLPAFAPIRRAVNEHTARELSIMATEISKGIVREATRTLPKVKG